jgi:hypothetical protein
MPTISAPLFLLDTPCFGDVSNPTYDTNSRQKGRCAATKQEFSHCQRNFSTFARLALDKSVAMDIHHPRRKNCVAVVDDLRAIGHRNGILRTDTCNTAVLDDNNTVDNNCARRDQTLCLECKCFTHFDPPYG